MRLVRCVAMNSPLGNREVHMANRIKVRKSIRRKRPAGIAEAVKVY